MHFRRIFFALPVHIFSKRLDSGHCLCTRCWRPQRRYRYSMLPGLVQRRRRDRRDGDRDRHGGIQSRDESRTPLSSANGGTWFRGVSTGVQSLARIVVARALFPLLPHAQIGIDFGGNCSARTVSRVWRRWVVTGSYLPRRSGRVFEGGATMGPGERLQLRLLVYEKPTSTCAELKVAT